jgi:cell division transport system ATP-binding protein
VIEFEDAGFSYGRTPVLEALNLTLEPGSFTFLLGPSGAGKTTLLRLCTLELSPTVGQVTHFGRRLREGDRDAIAGLRRTIGVVHQDCDFLDHLSLAENVALPLRAGGAAPGDREEDIDALLQWVDLGGRAGVRPPELTSGERQRAALARAVILSPELILADEPTGSIDWEMALRLLTLLVELNQMGKAVLVATHDPNLIKATEERMAVRVLRLHRGRVETRH